MASTAPNNGVIVGLQDDTFELVCSEENAFEGVQGAFPRDRWACVQLHVAIADAGGSVDLSIDGVERLRLDAIDTLPVDGYRNIHAGTFATSSSMTQTDVWIDELVASTSPIPCD